ncbi:MAG: hypothetical protein JXQ75_04120 [Phycisphaerae bacterium]|nr:hypothetical protein [Phycisphaerae bacterium]
MWRFCKALSIGLTALAVGSCATSAVGLDLTLRGMLNLLISRESTAATAQVSGSIYDNGSTINLVIQLENDQVLSVNGVPIANPLGFFGGTLGSVNAPDAYTVSFNNKGSVASMDVTPPVDYTSVTPADGTQVAKQGFDVTWSPSGDADVMVDIEITGLGPDGADSDGDPDVAVTLLQNLADDASVHVGAADLADFLAGEIAVEISRFRTFPEDLGLAGGQARVEIVKTVTLDLTD